MSDKLRKYFSDQVIFFTATIIVIFLLFLHVGYTSLQGLAVILFIVSLLLFQIIGKRRSENPVLLSKLLLFCLTLLVELLTVSTGGLTSHFLLLAALFAFAISFLRSMTSSLIFLLFFSILLTVQLLIDDSLKKAVSEDMSLVILFLLIYIFVTILSYILNRYYHVKDVFLEVLRKQIRIREIREESILSEIDELIIITERDLSIISVNNAVEKAVVLPKGELLGKPIFEKVLLRNFEGELLTKASLTLHTVLEEKKQVILRNLTLLSGYASPMGTYTLTVKPVRNLEGEVDQILFVVQSDSALAKGDRHNELIIDQIITKHAGLIENVKRSLQQRGIVDLAVKAEVIGKIDREIRQILALERTEKEIITTSVNAALVGKSTCEAMQNFSQALSVQLQYVFSDLTSEGGESQQSPDEKEQRLRVLYSVMTNLFWLEVLLHKLIEIAILLASTEERKDVTLAFKRVNSQVMISIKANTSKVTETNKDTLFTLNFDELQGNTNLSLASGLEGYIAKSIGERLQIPIAVHIQQSEVIFTLLIKSAETA